MTVLDKTHTTRVEDIFKISEATVSTDGSKMIEITVIRRGFGNPVGGRYYPSELLRESASKMVGLKMYQDHDTEKKMREREGQPRSVSELLGIIKEAWYDPQADAIKAKVKILRDWFWEIVSNDPSAVGVSIDAIGSGRNGVVEGKQAKIVESFRHYNSVDFVTEPGAGGTVDKLLESKLEAHAMGALDNLTVEMIRENRPDIIEALSTNNSGGNSDAGVTTEQVQEAVQSAVNAALETERTRHDRELRILESRSFVRDYLAGTALAPASQQAIAANFHDADFSDVEKDGTTVTGRAQLISALESAVKEKRDEISQYGSGFAVRGMGGGNSSSNDGGNNSGGAIPISESAPAHVQFYRDMGLSDDEIGISTAKDGGQ